jgi:hypothetical protein
MKEPVCTDCAYFQKDEVYREFHKCTHPINTSPVTAEIVPKSCSAARIHTCYKGKLFVAKPEIKAKEPCFLEPVKLNGRQKFAFWVLKGLRSVGLR